MTNDVLVKDLKANQMRQDALKAELEQLVFEERLLKAKAEKGMTPAQVLADDLHQLFCPLDHNEKCGWGYTRPGSKERREAEEAAQRILDRVSDNDEGKVDYRAAMAIAKDISRIQWYTQSN